MFATFKVDKERFSKKHISKLVVHILLIVLSIILCGQFIAQLFTVRQLSKVSGIIITKEVKLTSYTGSSKFKKGGPNYSLVVKLDNQQTYNIDFNTNDDWSLNDRLHVGDHVIIYNPTLIYNLISLDGLDFGSRANQVEVGDKVIYSFKAHQNRAWSFILYLVTAILISVYMKINLSVNHQ